MKVNRRNLNKINTRKRILKASRKLFSQKGYEESMMEDIAIKAEVSKTTIYNYFPNKESLLIGTADEVFERVENLLKNDFTNFRNSEEKIKLALDEFITASTDYLGLSRKITYLNSCEDSPLYGIQKNKIKLFKELVINAQNEELFISNIDPDDIVDVIMGIYLIAKFQWSNIDKYSPEYLKEKIERFYDIMLSAFRPN